MGYYYGTLPALDSSIQTALSDATAEVEVPAGHWRSAPISIYTSDKSIYSDGAILVPLTKANVQTWIGISSVFLGDVAGGEWQAQGTVTPSDDNLTLIGIPTSPAFFPGEIVQLRAGVNTSDPAEPQYQWMAEIESVVGDAITFVEVFGRTTTQYGDAATLQAATDPSQHFKIGDWAWQGGYFKRGYGDNVGIRRFSGGAPTNNVTIEGIGGAQHRYLNGGLRPPYGAAGIFLFYVRDCHIRRSLILHPTGVSCFAFGSEQCTFDGHISLGLGTADNFGTANAPITNPYLCGQWGNVDCDWDDIWSFGPNMILNNVEAGSTNIRVRRPILRRGEQGGVRLTQWFGSDFGVYGSNIAFRFEDVKIQSQNESSVVWPSTFSGAVVKNLTFETSYFPDNIDIRYPLFDSDGGYITVNGVIYGPRTAYSQVINLTSSGVSHALAEALYESATVELSSAAGITNVDAGVVDSSNVFTGGTICNPFAAASGYGYLPRGYSQSFYVSSRVVRVTGSTSGKTATVSGHRYPRV